MFVLNKTVKMYHSFSVNSLLTPTVYENALQVLNKTVKFLASTVY